MRDEMNKETTKTATPTLRCLTRLGVAALITLVCASSPAKDGNGGHYVQVNLVSDQPGVARLQDTNLVNAWGMSFSATSPFWISDNGTGKATLYAVTNDAAGTVHVDKQGLTVNIPGAGNPTGQLFDGAGHFNGDNFIFASEDGTISGWRGALGTTAEVLATRTNAIYKGIALATNATSPVLLAANFAEGTIDVYSTNLVLAGQFPDLSRPAGYAPFNVQNIHGIVFVTFAKQDTAKHDDVAGKGHGLIDTFDPATLVFRRFAAGSDAGGNIHDFNSPWGLAVSPAKFGKYSDALLVGNFGSGTIMAFDSDGKLLGLLKGHHQGPIAIKGLWGLTFGNGGRGGNANTLYFTAGPDDESHGLFGSLAPTSEGGDD
jgi:uncharacterized protein (TIGR03118 family)